MRVNIKTKNYPQTTFIGRSIGAFLLLVKDYFRKKSRWNFHNAMKSVFKIEHMEFKKQIDCRAI